MNLQDIIDNRNTPIRYNHITKRYEYSEQDIKDIVEELEESKWVSVKDELPQFCNCLISYKFGVGEAKFLAGLGKFVLPQAWSEEFPEVTHWMALPKKAK